MPLLTKHGVRPSASLAVGAQLLAELVKDRDDFVRGGAALSPDLTAEQIERLLNDPSPTTRLYVARNPQIPDDVLIRLHEEQGIELVWFAMNPKCPEPLKEKMRASSDINVLFQLEATQMRLREENSGAEH